MGDFGEAATDLGFDMVDGNEVQEEASSSFGGLDSSVQDGEGMDGGGGKMPDLGSGGDDFATMGDMPQHQDSANDITPTFDDDESTMSRGAPPSGGDSVVNSTTTTALPSSVSKPSYPPPPVQDSTALQEWTAKHETELNAKREEEDAAIASLREKAQAELQDWYAQRKKHIAQRQADLKDQVSSDKTSSGQSKDTGAHDSKLWEKVVSQIDPHQTTERDTTRMKEILISLKHTPIPLAKAN